jgi:hypothetical protein
MCQYIYNTAIIEPNKCLLSIARMVYAEVVHLKLVDWKTIKIEHKSQMIAPIE